MEGSRCILGHGLEIGFIVVGMIAATVLIVRYTRISAPRAKKPSNGGHNTYSRGELSEQGDRAVTVQYTLSSVAQVTSDHDDSRLTPRSSRSALVLSRVVSSGMG